MSAVSGCNAGQDVGAGKRVAAIPYGGGQIRVLETETTKVTVGDKTHPVTASNAIVSPDNTCFAVESGYNEEDKPEVRLYAMNTGKEIAARAAANEECG